MDSYICTLTLTTLKMVTWVTETRRCSLHNKITFIKPKWICFFFFSGLYTAGRNIRVNRMASYSNCTPYVDMRIKTLNH